MPVGMRRGVVEAESGLHRMLHARDLRAHRHLVPLDFHLHGYALALIEALRPIAIAEGPGE